MGYKKIRLSEGVRFHGHLGPYLVLGILAGELAARKLRFKRYFGLQVRVWGVMEKPKSCLIDGLQLSTGATYGKGNIKKFNSPQIKIEFKNLLNNKNICLRLNQRLMIRLKQAKTHRESEALARRLYKTDCSELFKLTHN